MKDSLVVVLVSFVVVALASVASAQDLWPDDRYKGYPKSLIQWPVGPQDMTMCQALELYEPDDTHLTKYASRVKIAGFRVQETKECTWMDTRYGWRWAMRPIGTKVAQDAQGRDLFDYGSPAGKVCMNPRPFSVAIVPIVAVAKRPVVSKPALIPPMPSPPMLPPPPPPPPSPLPPVREFFFEPTQPTEPYQEESRYQWGPTASAMVGNFSSVPVNGIVSRLADRDVCDIQGRAFDVGVAFGKPKSSFWRLTFAGKLVEDRSSTRYLCENCGTEVTTVAKGMRVWGVRGERVFRITDWPVQPMVTVHGGVGRVTGRAYRYQGPMGRPPTSVEEVGARELFGSDWFPLVGAGVGVMGDLGRHLTWGVTAVGVEYPGIYYGQVSLTYWPK